MRWLLSACFLGGLGALFRRWHWPYADWFNLAGFGVLLLGFLWWLNDWRDYWPGARSQGTDAVTGIDWNPVDGVSGFGAVESGGIELGDGGGSAD